jgi:molybdate transport system permease protein
MVETGPLWLSLKLAFLTTIILFAFSIPIANWLGHKKNLLKTITEVVISMPLVLPPSVIGFYLLLVFSPGNGFGGFLEKWFDLRLVFSFPGLLVASVIYSLPFMVHPIQSGINALPASLREASFSLGKTKLQTLLQVLLPNIKPALLTGIAMTFAHSMGEFGVVLMIGGNIPGKTRVASVAIYDEVESLNYHNANIYAIILLTLSFSILFILYMVNRKLQQPSII